MENENKDPISEEITEETVNETSEDTADKAESSSKKGITPEATFDSPNGKSVHRPIVYLELVLAIVALVAIIVLILDYRKKNNTVDPNAAGTTPTSAIETTLPGGEIDNSIVAASKPATPDPASLNKLTEDECQKRVAEGTMLRLDVSDGTYVYVSNYKDSEYFASRLEITEEVIDRFIRDELLADSLVPIEADHEVAELNDVANIDYCGKKDGVAFEGGTAAGYDLTLGSGTFIPGFEEGVVGMKVGETKDIPLTFPTEYHSEELAGKEVVFTVTLNSIKAMGYTTEINDEIANYLSSGMCPTVAEMKDYLRENVLPSEVIRLFLMEDLYVSGLKESDIDIYYQDSIDTLLKNVSQYGVSFETYVSAQGYTVTEVLDMVMDDCIDQARADVLYRAVLENDLEPVSDDDLTAMAADYGYADNPDEFIEYNGREYLMQYLMRDKAGAYLQDMADKAMGIDEADEVIEEIEIDESETTETPDADASVEPAEESSETTATDAEEVSENAATEN